MESLHGASPAEPAPESPSISHERRRARRHKVFTPAYANLSGSAQGAVLELNEIINLSETGVCIQAPATMQVNRLLPLGIDLSATGGQIRTVGHVVWSEASGRTGIRLPEMAEASLMQVREWLVANAQAGSDAGRESMLAQAEGNAFLLTEWEEIEKEVERRGPDLDPALNYLAQQALTLTWASGTAIALINQGGRAEMICQARAGKDSPELGARLELGAGFSGECVRSGLTLKCDDAEFDSRVDRESCRGLGIRSIVACPVKRKDGLIGIVEVFSRKPAAFRENDVLILERLSNLIEVAVRRAMRVRADPPGFSPSVAAPNADARSADASVALPSFETESRSASRSAGRKIPFMITAIVCITAGIWLAAPWMEKMIPSLHSGASSTAATLPTDAKADSSSSGGVFHESYVGMDIKELRKLADTGNGDAEYALGKRYALADGVTQDYHEAMNWFLAAAEQGNVRAQEKAAACFWAGKGVPRDYGKAYFWALLAEAGGETDASFYRTDSGNYLSQAQSDAEHIAAENWLHTHHIGKASQ